MAARLRAAAKVALTLIVIALAAAWMLWPSTGQRFRLTGWGSGATLEIREDGTGGLLFAPGIRFTEPPEGAPRDEAYRLDANTLELTAVSTQVWNAAPGDVVDCDRAGLIGEGAYTRVSPDQRLVSTLNARGVSIPSVSLIPTLGGSRVFGWRYHQFQVFPSRQEIGSRISLGFGSSDPMPCWTPDAKSVIYFDPAFTEVVFVPVP